MGRDGKSCAKAGANGKANPHAVDPIVRARRRRAESITSPCEDDTTRAWLVMGMVLCEINSITTFSY